MAATLSNLGELVLLDGDADWAARRFAETLALAQQVGLVPHTAWALTGLGLAAVYQTDKERAAPLLRQALRLARDLRGRPTVAECLAGLAAVTADPAAAARLWGAVQRLHDDLASPLPPLACSTDSGWPPYGRPWAPEPCRPPWLTGRTRQPTSCWPPPPPQPP